MFKPFRFAAFLMVLFGTAIWGQIAVSQLAHDSQYGCLYGNGVSVDLNSGLAAVSKDKPSVNTPDITPQPTPDNLYYEQMTLDSLTNVAYRYPSPDKKSVAYLTVNPVPGWDYHLYI